MILYIKGKYVPSQMKNSSLEKNFFLGFFFFFEEFFIGFFSAESLTLGTVPREGTLTAAKAQVTMKTRYVNMFNCQALV